MWTALVVALVTSVPGALGYPAGGMWLIHWLLPLASATAALGLTFSRAEAPRWPLLSCAVACGLAAGWWIPPMLGNAHGAYVAIASGGAVGVVAFTARRRGLGVATAQALTFLLGAGLVGLWTTCVAAV